MCGLARTADGVKLLLDPERLIQDEDFTSFDDLEDMENEAEEE